MAAQRITSKDNAACKALRALSHDPRARRQMERTVLDGVHLIEAGLQAAMPFDSLWLAESALDKPEIARLAAMTGEVKQYILPDPLFNAAAPTGTPAGVMAVIRTPPEVRPRAEGTVLVLDGVQDAGNVGTMLRTAAAVAVSQVWLAPGCAQAWSPRVLRAGMGAHFLLPIVEGVDVLTLIRHTTMPVFATALDASTSVFASDLRGPAVWLFGAEGRGLSAELLACATQRLHIPMPGKIESLNVAAAAAVCLFEQMRQRGLA